MGSLGDHHYSSVPPPCCIFGVVQVKCKPAPGKRPNKGSCAIRMRVAFVFSGGLNMTLPAGATNPEHAAQELITQQGYNCGVLAFNDTLNVLNVCIALGSRLSWQHVQSLLSTHVAEASSGG